MNAKPWLVRTALGLSVSAALGTALIGFAHTPWGRPLLKLPLLSALAQHADCPVGSIEPAAFEQVRAAKLRSELGRASASSHPALGFTLGQTHRPEVERWASAQHASCETGFVASVLECEHVTLDPTPMISHVRLQFDGQERLVSVDLFRADEQPGKLVARFEELSSELERKVGPSTSSIGTPSVSFLRSAPLQMAVRAYNYRDYVAKATLLNMGKRGLRLREQYQWLPPADPA
jgi:hypothetical protein